LGSRFIKSAIPTHNEQNAMSIQILDLRQKDALVTLLVTEQINLNGGYAYNPQTYLPDAIRRGNREYGRALQLYTEGKVNIENNGNLVTFNSIGSPQFFNHVRTGRGTAIGVQIGQKRSFQVDGNEVTYLGPDRLTS
jgi:hypothetical protein